MSVSSDPRSGIREAALTPAARWRSILASGLFSVVLLYVPLGLLFVFLPILLLAWRDRGRSALLALIVAWLAAAGLHFAGAGGGTGAGLYPRLTELFLFSSVGLAFGATALSGRTLTRAGVYAIVPWILVAGLGLVSALRLDHAAVETTWQQAVLAPTDEMLAQVGSAQNVEEDVQEQTTQFRALLKEHQAWLLYLTPAWLGLLLMFVLWSNIWVLKTLEPGFAGLEPLRNWRPPDVWFGGLILAIILTLSRITPLMAIGLNLLVIGGGIYLMSGLSLTAFSAGRWRIQSWVLVSVMALLTLSGGLPLLAVFGILDFWLDFRQRWRRADDQREPFDDV